jgi:hypothetical protein
MSGVSGQHRIFDAVCYLSPAGPDQMRQVDADSRCGTGGEMPVATPITAPTTTAMSAIGIRGKRINASISAHMPSPSQTSFSKNAGVLSRVQRIKRVREPCPDLMGDGGWRWRVLRTSNSYAFADPSPAGGRPNSSKSEKPIGTANQDYFSSLMAASGGDRTPPAAVKEAFGREIAKTVPSASAN